MHGQSRNFLGLASTRIFMSQAFFWPLSHPGVLAYLKSPFASVLLKLHPGKGKRAINSSTQNLRHTRNVFIQKRYVIGKM